MLLHQVQQLQTAAPDNWPEAVASVIVAILSWWLSRKTKKGRR